MFFTSFTSSSPHENLAWDEAIVELADVVSESDDSGFDVANHTETLRIWEFASPTVVLGRSSRVAQEVNLPYCEQTGIPVLRRSSGGSTIVAGPGCLMYSLLLVYRKRPECRSIDVAHRVVMKGLRQAVGQTLETFGLDQKVEWLGTCDLTIGEKKFSGNALRCKRNVMLYHGTILLNMPLDWIYRALLQPPRQPTYRKQRDHQSFVQNLLPEGFSDVIPFRINLVESLRSCWGALESWDRFPWIDSLDQKCQDLLRDRYLDTNWHLER
jgi:lipoate---protein ligase